MKKDRKKLTKAPIKFLSLDETETKNIKTILQKTNVNLYSDTFFKFVRYNFFPVLSLVTL